MQPESSMGRDSGEVCKVSLKSSPDLWETPEMTDLNMSKVWNALFPWFKRSGYNLYVPKPNSPHLWVPSEGSNYLLTDVVRYPYAHYSSQEPTRREFKAENVPVIAAVNLLHRDVVIKMVKNDSPELVILNMLSSEPTLSDPLNFTVPVLEILQYDEDYSFVVMPRWGDITPTAEIGFDCLETAFKLVEDMIKALAFLHKNLIVHRDLKPGNILVNYQYEPGVKDLRPFFATKKARFVLCDFGISFVFPPDTPLAQRVRPEEESEYGTFDYQPRDVNQDQEVYDPFSYDVPCLGGVLCELVGYLTPLVPPLAPFLDRLVTPDIPTRYTAAQALDAFLEMKQGLDYDFLSSTSTPTPPYEKKPGEPMRWQSYDRWAKLPLYFVKKHASLYKLVRPKESEV